MPGLNAAFGLAQLDKFNHIIKKEGITQPFL